MTAAAQFFNDSGWEGPFHFNRLAAAPLPARRIQGGLGIEVIVDCIQEDLELPLGLHESPHDAKGPYRTAVFRQEAGNDGMVRFLSRPDAVITGQIHGEVVSPVTEGNAIPRHDDTRPETIVVALDERNHIAFAIGAAQVNGTATVYIDGLRQQGLIGNEGPPPVGIFRGQPLIDRRLHEARVGDILLAIAKSQLHGFNLPVERFSLISFTKGKPAGNIQGHEDDQAMAVGRHFPDIIASVTRMNRVDPLRPVDG